MISLNDDMTESSGSGGPQNLTPDPDPDMQREWIFYSGGIIAGVVLLELLLVLLVVICRKCQIRRKEREHVYHVRRGDKRSKLGSRSTYTQSTCVVSEVEPELETNIAYSAVTVSPSGPDKTAAQGDNRTPEEVKHPKGGEVRERQEATETHKDHPKVVVEEPIPVGRNCSYEPLAIDKSTRATSSNFSVPHQLSLGGENTNSLSTHDSEIPKPKSSKKTGGIVTSLSVDQLQVDEEKEEMEQAYKVLDEIEKQFHILSQSIPMLDVYGNEIVKPPPTSAPKISRSIPTLLDIAGYEDVDTVKKNRAPAAATKLSKPAATATDHQQLGVGVAGYEDLDTVRPNQKRTVTTKQPHVGAGADFHADKAVASTSSHDKSLVSTHATQMKQGIVQAERGNTKKTDEPVYSVVQKKPKAFSVSDLTEEPPPVPPMTAEALYTALQKPKKNTARYYSAIIPDESLPYFAAAAHYKCDHREENPPIKASISMEQILKDEGSKSCIPPLVQPGDDGPTLHAQHPNTTDPITYIYEDELQTDL